VRVAADRADVEAAGLMDEAGYAAECEREEVELEAAASLSYP